MPLSRRQFVRTGLSAAAVSMLPFRFSLPRAQAQAFNRSEEFPLQQIPGGSSQIFNGDEVDRTHRILWDIQNVIRQAGGLPPPSEDHSVVVIGGGIAGLSAAYALKDQKPLLLEQDRSFGGNSKGEIVGQNFYSIGAAYLMAPKPGEPIAKFLHEIGVLPYARPEAGADTTVFFQNRFAKGFWQGTTDPTAQASFVRVFQVFQEYNQRFEASQGDEPWIMELDRMNFEQWMRQALGPVHPHVHEYLQLYAWSSFTASLDELSAAQMLEFIASETGTLLALPGGNAAIAQAAYGRLVQMLGTQVRSRCIVIHVQALADSVLVTYVDPENRLKTVRARAAVMAAPKFVAKRVIQGLPADQFKAMDSIRYRGYVVANLLLDRKISSPSYELYCLQGEPPPTPGPYRQSTRPFTDVVFGSWAQHDQPNRSVLTVYKAFAFDGDRAYLFNPATHDKFKAQVLQGIQPVLQGLGLGPQNLQAVRMTRWGHSLPVASVGLMASGMLEVSHRPVGGRIFFANQDNWANPSFETAFEEAMTAAEAARAVLSSERLRR